MYVTEVLNRTFKMSCEVYLAVVSSLWDLSLQTWVKPMPPAVQALSPRHWEFPNEF